MNAEDSPRSTHRSPLRPVGEPHSTESESFPDEGRLPASLSSDAKASSSESGYAPAPSATPTPLRSAAPSLSSRYARLRRPLRGEVSARGLLLETLRRARLSLELRWERAALARASRADAAARLCPEFAARASAELLAHFRGRSAPRFPPGFETAPEDLSRLARQHFPSETEELLASARKIVAEHRWPLLGCGEFAFGAEIDWLRDPLTGALWPADFHADVKLARGDGSDARVLWELNRLGHLVALGQAYALTADERFAATFFAHVESWRAQNPVGCGPNWASAMEVALRAVNLLAAFQLFRRSPQLDERRLASLLSLFDEHGRHVRRHLEFSHLATGNHYLSNVAGLLWLGLLLPELEAARAWREWALRELQRELSKQVLADGAHYESSTGYHRLVCELFLHSFLLCHANSVELEESGWLRLRLMLGYVCAYLRPDGRAPLVGDTDGGRFLPLARRAADDHGYLPALGAAVFDEPRLKLTPDAPFELLWLLGEESLRAYAQLPVATPPSSLAYSRAGTFVLREGDLYLLLSASGAGLKGRGSHAHNDALSIEVSACGASFVADPGTYVYTADAHARQLFRSTAYHSTVEIDGAEQNTTDEETPFCIGDEARPRLLRWERGEGRDVVVAEHYGYTRLRGAITHARAVTLDKRRRLWLIEDSFAGAGAHTFRFRFHAARGVETRVREWGAELYDGRSGARLHIIPHGIEIRPEVEARWTSRDYGERAPSQCLCWRVRAHAPLKVAWALVPVCAGEDERERLEFAGRSGELG